MLLVFRCTAKTPRAGDTNPAPLVDIALDAVPAKENAAWSTVIPYGHLVLAVDVPEAAAVFEVGKEYRLEVSAVPPPETPEP